MSFRRSHRPTLVCRTLILLGLAAAAAAADSEPIHWWNGQSRVDAVLALDELQVEGRDAAMLTRERLATAIPGLRASEVATATHNREVAATTRTTRRNVRATIVGCVMWSRV